MSLKYGLNVKKSAPAPRRKTIFDDGDDDDEDDEALSTTKNGVEEEEITTFTTTTTTNTAHNGKPPTRAPPPPRTLKQPSLPDDTSPAISTDLSSAAAAHSHIRAAEQVDPSIFDYDTFLTAKTAAQTSRQAAAKQDALARKPKYVNNLLESAARRKQDQLVAKEKALQREREKEGADFEGVEKFVTGAYREVQAEARRLEAEEERRKGEEEERRRKGGGGMGGFYRGLMEERERLHQEGVEAAERAGREGVEGAGEGEGEGEGKSERALADEARARGRHVHVNDEGQITDKRELLSAGLNIGSSSAKGGDAKGADHLRTSARPSHINAFARNDGGKQAQRERQSRMMEEQLAAQAKRAREEEDEERERMERAAKSSKTAKDVGDAKARFLARKAAKEKEKAGG